MLDNALTALVTLLVVVDPIGLAPLFLAVTQGLDAATRRAIGLRAAAIATLILAGTAVAGGWLLDRLGIGLPAFRISGGILLFMTAFDMVLGSRSARETRQAADALAERVRDVAAFPLAIPLTAGPGAITATLLLAGRTGYQPAQLAILIAIIAATGGICAIAFLLATQIARSLGASANALLSRLLGVLLAALAVQFVVDGIKAVLAS